MSSPRKPPFWALLGLLLAFSGLYFATRTRVHTFDALAYTLDVETKPLLELYHPHHLLYGPSGRLVDALARAGGYDGRADVPIQALNALAGGTGLALLWAALARLSGNPWTSLPPVLLLGTGYAYWRYAAEVEVYTLATAFLSLCLLLLSAHRPDFSPHQRWGWAALLGASQAGAVMFHQTHVLFAVPLGLWLMYALRRPWSVLLAYGAALSVGVGLPYLAVGLASGWRTPAAFYDWLTAYAQSGRWGGYLSLTHLPALRQGLGESLSPQAPLAALAFALILALWGAKFFIPRPLWPDKKAWLALMGAWALVYGAFFWWWEPWNIEFWLALTPLWGLALIWPALSRSRWRGVLAVLLVGLAGGFLLENGTRLRREGDPANDYTRRQSEALAPVLAPQDMILTRGDILDLYLPFYAGVPPSQVLSLRTWRQNGGDLWGALAHAHARGQIIWVEALVYATPADPQSHPFGFTEAELADFRARYPLYTALELDGATAFYSIGRRADPTTRAWRFENHLGGWLEFGAGRPRFQNGAWCITGGGDPWLESPPLRLPAEAYPRLRLTLELSAPASHGQLFWRRQDEGLDEARSLRFPLRQGKQSYTLDLAGREGWTGDIVFLRLDPLPENTTTTACLYDLALGE